MALALFPSECKMISNGETIRICAFDSICVPQMVNKLEVSERSIESLHEQIAQMNCNDAMERASSHHDKMMTTMSERFDQQLQEVNEKLDQCRIQLMEKVVILI